VGAAPVRRSAEGDPQDSSMPRTPTAAVPAARAASSSGRRSAPPAFLQVLAVDPLPALAHSGLQPAPLYPEVDVHARCALLRGPASPWRFAESVMVEDFFQDARHSFARKPRFEVGSGAPRSLATAHPDRGPRRPPGGTCFSVPEIHRVSGLSEDLPGLLEREFVRVSDEHDGRRVTRGRAEAVCSGEGHAPLHPGQPDPRRTR
jgi:hypothetical protein